MSAETQSGATTDMSAQIGVVSRRGTEGESPMNASLRPGDRTLVTGGPGLLGSAVVRALITRAGKGRPLVRPTRPRDNLDGLNCEVGVADLPERDSVTA